MRTGLRLVVASVLLSTCAFPVGWAQCPDQRLTPPAPEAHSTGFYATAIAADASWAFVAEPHSSQAAEEGGAVHCYQRQPGQPQFAQWQSVQTLFASDVSAGCGFGHHLSFDGTTLVATSLIGRIYLFENSGGMWVEVQRILAPPSQFYGKAEVAGDTFVVSRSGTALNPSRLFVFRRDVATWVEQQELTAPNGLLFSPHFGFDGARVVVASMLQNPSVFVFEQSNPGIWESTASFSAQYLVTTVDISGDTIAVGELILGANQFSVDFYSFDGSGWSSSASLPTLASAPSSLQLEGDRATALFGQSLWLFQRSANGTWTATPESVYDTGAVESSFLSPGGIWVGDVGQLVEGLDCGVAYFFADTTSPCSAPIGDLLCERNAASVHLSWTPTGSVGELEIWRNGALLDTLPSNTSSFDDPYTIFPESRFYQIRAISAAGSCCAGSCGVDSGKNVYVDGSIPSGGDGSQSAPFNDLLAALDSPLVHPGDTVIVEPGAYAGPFFAPQVAIRSSQGPEQTILTTNAGTTVVVGNRLQGFTIQGGTDSGVEIIGGTLRDCIVENNSGSFGGGVRGFGTIDRCIIRFNFALWGGGVSGDFDIFNSLILNNGVNSFGSSLRGNMNLTNCTLVDAGIIRSAIHVEEELRATNCIFQLGGAEYPIRGDAGFNLEICNSLIDGGWVGRGNLSGLASFVDALAADYSLLPGSVEVDRGDNDAVANFQLDLAGNLRIQGGTVDLGAYELFGSTCQQLLDGLETTVDGTNVGLTWGPQAFVAIEVQRDGVTLANLPGTAVSFEDSPGAGRHCYTFVITTGTGSCQGPSTVVDVPGTWFVDASSPSGDGSVGAPFPRINDALESEDVVSGSTILIAPGNYVENLKLGGKDLVLSGVEGATATVVQAQTVNPVLRLDRGQTALSRIEGLSLTGGLGTDFAAGGVAFLGCRGGEIRNCRIVGNSADQFFGLGGGVTALDSSVVVRDCLIANNAAFSLAGVGAGALVDIGSNVDFIGCTFSGNKASATAAVSSGPDSFISMTRCLVYENFGPNAAVSAWNGTITHCTFFDDLMPLATSGQLSASNSILWRTTSTATLDPGVSASFCIVSGGAPGVGNLELDPQLGIGFVPVQGSPCIDAGDPNSPLDADGTIADIGAIPSLLGSSFLFIRGDTDGNGLVVGLVDGLFLLNYQFSNGAEPPCIAATDTNGDDSAAELLDTVYLLLYQFGAGDPPPAPFPGCGVVVDSLPCNAVTCP